MISFFLGRVKGEAEQYAKGLLTLRAFVAHLSKIQADWPRVPVLCEKHEALIMSVHEVERNMNSRHTVSPHFRAQFPVYTNPLADDVKCRRYINILLPIVIEGSFRFHREIPTKGIFVKMMKMLLIKSCRKDRVEA